MTNYRAPPDRRFRQFTFGGSKSLSDQYSKQAAKTPKAAVLNDEEINSKVQEAFFETARQLLPDIPETDKLLRLISNIDHQALCSVEIISSQLEGVYGEKRLFTLMAATLLSFADNVDSIERFFDQKVVNLLDEMRRMEDAAGQNDQYALIRDLSRDAQTLILTNIAGKLLLSRETLLSKENTFVPKEELKKAANHIIRSVNAADDLDGGLLMATVQMYNEICELSGHTMRMGMTDNGALFLDSGNPPPPGNKKKKPPPKRPPPRSKK